MASAVMIMSWSALFSHQRALQQGLFVTCQTTFPITHLLDSQTCGTPLEAEKPDCTPQGHRVLPELEKAGDLIIGGIFSFRTGQDGYTDYFTKMPEIRPCKECLCLCVVRAVPQALEKQCRKEDLSAVMTVYYAHQERLATQQKHTYSKSQQLRAELPAALLIDSVFPLFTYFHWSSH
ncbi:hypothetical protein DPX16_4187 [Anabarilius grahami]|uniref:Uncharacterized protein n=1 Tax=Anabarilius grahami TaxID=495550 RepID=A0A3N0XRI4_ANAGA|nr:hypothetical protein DPX16_4187 [Anabarilius grahami]